MATVALLIVSVILSLPFQPAGIQLAGGVLMACLGAAVFFDLGGSRVALTDRYRTAAGSTDAVIPSEGSTRLLAALVVLTGFTVILLAAMR